jgi:hypothetical protein
MACYDIQQRTYNGQKLNYPCGKCADCRTKRQSGWAYRLGKEAEISNSAFFITMTYDDHHVPHTPNLLLTLCKRDLQLFFKRLRKKQKGKIVYYAAGEYGSETHRPHYHIIMFNLESIDYLEEAWGKGFIHIGSVTDASCYYTLKYLDKVDTVGKHRMDDRVKEFQLMSKGIGKSYLTDAMIKYHKADLTERCFITVPGGFKIALPRYYKKKIYTEEEMKLIGMHYQVLELQKDLETISRETAQKMEKQRRFDRRKQPTSI